MTMKLKSHFGSAASVSLLTIGLIAGATGNTTSANAQTSYYWGNTQLDDAVSVNLNVLDTLGEAPNLPGLLSPRATPAPKPMAMPNKSLNTQAPRLTNSSAASSFPSSGLTNNATASGMPTSGLVSSMPKAVTPKPTPAAAPTPAPTPVKAPEKKQEAKIQTPAPTPAPAPKPTPAPAPAPKAAEVEKEKPKVVKKAPEPGPQPTATPAATPAIPESKLVKKEKPKAEMKVAEAEVKPVPAPSTPPATPKVEKKTNDLVSVTPKPVPEAAPALAPAPKKTEEIAKKTETQIASVPKVADPKIVKTEGDVIRILFSETATDVPGGAKPALDDLVKMMQENEDMGLQLEGYANIPNASPNQSRRMSLFRAISVRNYLVKHEIQSRRIEVRALGNKSDEASADRVDVFIKN